MTLRNIERNEWREYFDDASKTFKDAKIDIIVTESQLGAQIEASRIPLLGLTYDTADDSFCIIAEKLEHVIPKPAQILVEERDGVLESLEVIRDDGTKEILSFAPAS